MKNFKKNMYRTSDGNAIVYYIGNTFFHSIAVTICTLFLNDKNNNLKYIKINTNNKHRLMFKTAYIQTVYFYDRNR